MRVSELKKLKKRLIARNLGANKYEFEKDPIRWSQANSMVMIEPAFGTGAFRKTSKPRR